jgi:ankyrin repeat protein
MISSSMSASIRNDLDIILELCAQGTTDKVLALLDCNPSLLDEENNEGWNCLINASKMGHVELVEALLSRGASTRPSSKHSALRGAAIFNHLEVVRALVQAGHAIDALSSGRKTALMGAAMNGHLEVVILLVSAGANIAIVNDFGETAIELASRGSYIDILNELTRQDVVVN